MDIKVLGAGCANCNKLEQMVIDVLRELNEEANVSHVKDLREILSYNVMRTPALVVNNQVKLSGVVPSKDKLRDIITSELKKRG
ncbi:thioredoxin family protein [Pelotomaculum isophthalicicum JI]|uniref:Thioredoxin family protein n=1 Tax=Pelotomaculum isophthalicicum JI TaxID=947010 RepID=A0A9X4H5I6_9FIRM|nr:thioredoxin family protein [Pelotomaculum isophthalicicum]MDF9409693.1 thioredoxin family protein [Pelotomaculum isophthalicicum JI]